jgi:pyruvate dehydrogenase E2 component (dihydrolipoamide acetyltransferase)
MLPANQKEGNLVAHLVLMPQVGISEESALLAQWHVAVGDTVKLNQLLFTLETDKSTFEIESEVEGVVLALLCGEGDERNISDPVCVIGQPGDTWELSKETSKFIQKKTVLDASIAALAIKTPPLSASIPSRKSGISPRAKMTAERIGIDPHSALPTGSEGRIIERDILAAGGRIENVSEWKPETQKPTQSDMGYQDVPHSRIRKVIAANMRASLQTLAQLTHHHSFDATALLEIRKRCKGSNNELLQNITIGDMVLFTAAYTLGKHRQLNAHYYDDYLRVFEHVNLGVAVDTPRGLMVPTIMSAELLSVSELSRQVKRRAEECRKGNVDPSLLKNATFTVSNLGAAGVEMFTPIINPPQVGILGVCNITYRLKADGSVYPAMGLSFTYDHRAVDGAPASRFMQDLCGNLEGIERLCLI